jgi:DNA helicase II / ATP-dependent DNA helicase PcrA
MAVELSTLNPQQREAVLHTTGPVLVLAGAGSGKTRVVTYRTARLLSVGVPADRLLVVTFTNKAAAEMRGRILGMVGGAAGRELALSTFHAFGVRLLRRFITRLGYRPGFTILDQADQLRVVKEALIDLGLERTSTKPDAILRILSQAKRARTQPAGLRELRFSPLLPYAQRVYEAYEAHLRSLNAVDFDDLLRLPIELCAQDEEVRAEVGGLFDYVMVDEYQDTNATQLEFVRRLAPHGNLMAVGDDDQSIYAFQGAVAENLLDFERIFPGARLIKLEQNYRSTGTILDAANAVIAQNRARHAKRLWSARGAGEKIRFVSVLDEREEAAFVAGELEALRAAGVRYEAMAVLYRINSQSRLFEEALRLRGLPYRVVGSTELFDRAEVRDWLAYLRLCLNTADELSLRRVLNIPRRGLGAKAVAVLERAAERMGAPLFVALRRAAELDELSAAARAGAQQLVGLIERHGPGLRKAFGAHLTEAAGAYLEATGLLGHIRQTEKNVVAAARRAETVQQLVEGMGAGERGGTLAAWLAHVTLEQKSVERAGDDATGVTLLTLHSAKGLEFPQVFLVGFEEGLLPHKRTLEQPSAIAEERRLCYVGMTRAMDRLTLTAARTRTRRSERLPRQPSRFLQEIPRELVLNDSENQALASARTERNLAQLAQIQALLRRSGG